MPTDLRASVFCHSLYEFICATSLLYSIVIIYLLLFLGDPWALRGQEWYTHVPGGPTHSTVSYSLHIAQLWVSVNHHSHKEASLSGMGEALIYGSIKSLGTGSTLYKFRRMTSVGIPARVCDLSFHWLLAWPDDDTRYTFYLVGWPWIQ